MRENDVFPEEFPDFLSLPGAARGALLEAHADLFTAEFWRAMQVRLQAGEIPRVFPYPAERRFPRAV